MAPSMGCLVPAWEERLNWTPIKREPLKFPTLLQSQRLKLSWTRNGKSMVATESKVPSSAPEILLEILPRPLSSTLLRRTQETVFQDRFGGEVHVYSKEHNLRLHLLKPPAAKKSGCVVLFHGGSWVFGSPSQFYRHAQSIAADTGLAVACCEYRLLMTHPRSDAPFDAVADAGQCLRYLHTAADELGLDKGRFALGGISAGGQVATMAAFKNSDLNLAGLVLLNPVLDLHFRAGWEKQKPLVWIGSRLLRARYGSSALEAMSPLHQIRNLPFPTLILHGLEDELIPLAQSEAFCAEMQRSGNTCTLIGCPEVDHHLLRAADNHVENHLQTLSKFLTSVGLVETPCDDVEGYTLL